MHFLPDGLAQPQLVDVRGAEIDALGGGLPRLGPVGVEGDLLIVERFLAAVVRLVDKELEQVGLGRVVEVERRDIQDQIHRLEDARKAGMRFERVARFDGGTDGEEDRPMPVDVIESILGVVLDHEDDRVLPAGAVGNEIHGETQGGVVVLHETRERPGLAAVGEHVVRSAAVVVGIIEIHVGGAPFVSF